jgi:two-component system, chemotaxis family, protein-glutamate methylesterase/glutaminase
MPMPNAKSYSSQPVVARSAASSPLPRTWGRSTPEDREKLALRPMASGVMAVAASTGGPQELARLLATLPENFPYAVVIAQHIAEGFAGGLARWLGRFCALPVVLAQGGEPLVSGVVYVSPTDRNLTVTVTRHTGLVAAHDADLYHPSCDTLLNSAARVYGRACIGVILSGMGDDGARGIAAIKSAGGMTFAQDEATSVVFGMNGAAVRMGGVQHVMPSDRIGERIVRHVGSRA